MTVHAAPTIVPCCRVDITQLPDRDKVTNHRQRVTCHLDSVDGVAEYLAGQILIRNPDRPVRWVASLVGLSPEHVDRLR